MRWSLISWRPVCQLLVVFKHASSRREVSPVSPNSSRRPEGTPLRPESRLFRRCFFVIGKCRLCLVRNSNESRRCFPIAFTLPMTCILNTDDTMAQSRDLTSSQPSTWVMPFTHCLQRRRTQPQHSAVAFSLQTRVQPGLGQFMQGRSTDTHWIVASGRVRAPAAACAPSWLACCESFLAPSAVPRIAK